MDNYIPISFLNDFIFCPRSIYFHQLYAQYDTMVFQGKYQVAGKVAHKTIDEKKYSTKSTVLQSTEIVSHEYGIYGKIDLYYLDKKELRERKKSIKTIYDGYVFQVYAQYFALKEMGFDVEKISIHDLTKNQIHYIPLPEKDPTMFTKFKHTIEAIKNYSLLDKSFSPSLHKCEKCIYKELCDYSLC